MSVREFQGEFRFLSNFWPVAVVLDGQTYASVEHAYQAAKTNNEHHRRMIRHCRSAGQARRAGRAVDVAHDWEKRKLSVMEALLRQKFARPDLLEKLLAVEGDIVEGNPWGDRFWGVSGGEGANHLGRLLMKIRDEHQEEGNSVD